MQPSDHPVDPDADPTRVRPERLPATDLPEPDLSDDPDADPTTVRPRFPQADDVDADAAHTGVAPRTSTFWGEPARPDDRDDAGAASAATRPTSWDVPRDRPSDGYPADEYAGRHSDRRAERLWSDGSADSVGAPADPDGAPTTVLTVAHDSERPHRRRDWAWVEEWRAERAAPAWGPGIATGTFVALIVAVALIVLTSGVSDSPLLAIVFNVVIAAGMAPALWLCRSLPVLRFLAAGAAVGILAGWIWMITTF